MRNAIARALALVLAVLGPRRPGRHSAEYFAELPASTPAPVSPWSRPWTAPSSVDVRAIFKDERTRELPELQRERVWAAEFASLGVDYDFPTVQLGSLVKRERVCA